MIKRLLNSRVLRLFSSAVIDQVVLSAANFGLGLLLIRNTEEQHYGLYVLTQSTVLLLASVYGAAVGSPLSIVASKKSEAERRAMVGAVDLSLRRLLIALTVVAMPLAPLLYALGWIDGLHAAVAMAGVVAAWAALRREYSRTVLLMYSRPGTILSTDLLYVAVLLSGAALAAFGPLRDEASVVAVLALAMAAFAGSWRGRYEIGRHVGWTAGAAKSHWKEMRSLAIWATLGAVTYWLLSQSYNSIVAAKLGPQAVTAVNAARLLLMPTYLLANGVKGLLVPMSARWLHEEGLRALIRKLGLFIVGIAGLSLLYFAVLWICRNWLVSNVLKKSFVQLDFMLLGWGGLVLINLVRDMYQNVLQARERFRILAVLVAISAAVSIGCMWFAIDRYGLVGALIGMICGESAYLIGILALLWQECRHDARIRMAQPPAALS